MIFDETVESKYGPVPGVGYSCKKSVRKRLELPKQDSENEIKTKYLLMIFVKSIQHTYPEYGIFSSFLYISEANWSQEHITESLMSISLTIQNRFYFSIQTIWNEDRKYISWHSVVGGKSSKHSTVQGTTKDSRAEVNVK